MNRTLIVLLGPTCVGKTSVSIALARHLRSEIISADSRQFYSEMRIGTAVPSDEQLSEIPHHFIRSISITRYYSSSLFERDVLNLLPELFSRNNTIVMTGGSGMYIDAVCHGIDNIPDVDPSVREKYQRKYSEEGIEGLRIALKLLDPEHYTRVDLKNPKRIIRALEICETAGRPYSAFLTKKRQERDFRIIKIGLERPRDELYRRINERVDSMIADGLVEEAKKLFSQRGRNALNTVGYSELFSYFEGKITMDKAIELIKRNTRRFAKRQMTWWARDKEIAWFSPEKLQEILKYIEDEMRLYNLKEH